MKKKILALRLEGKSYKEICEIVGCNKATVSYHCGNNQKEKSQARQKRRRKDKVLDTKIERYRHRTLYEKGRSFQRRDGSKLGSRKEYNFTSKDLIDKLGERSKCYLSGREIDLKDGKSYHLDHIIPATRGGSNELENAGLLHATINKMKHDLTPEEFISTCIEILEYQGFKITKESNSGTVSDPVC